MWREPAAGGSSTCQAAALHFTTGLENNNKATLRPRREKTSSATLTSDASPPPATSVQLGSNIGGVQRGRCRNSRAGGVGREGGIEGGRVCTWSPCRPRQFTSWTVTAIKQLTFSFIFCFDWEEKETSPEKNKIQMKRQILQTRMLLSVFTEKSDPSSFLNS